MNNKVNIPQTVKDAFPALSDAVFFKQFTLPDTTFVILSTDSKDLLSLVITDYADPSGQSVELKKLSEEHEFEFTNLAKPYSKNHETIEILRNDDMEGNFFVTVPHKNYRLYYYLANVKATS